MGVKGRLAATKTQRSGLGFPSWKKGAIPVKLCQSLDPHLHAPL